MYSSTASLLEIAARRNRVTSPGVLVVLWNESLGSRRAHAVFPCGKSAGVKDVDQADIVQGDDICERIFRVHAGICDMPLR